MTGVKWGHQVVVCDTMNPVGCQTKHVATYKDHSATAHGNAQQPPPARAVRVCSPSLGVGKKGCKLIPDFHRMAADEHKEMMDAVAEKHELSFLLVKLDLHAESEEVLTARVGNLKTAVAAAIGLRFKTDVDHLVLKPALGPQPGDWIEVIKVADLNCTEPHECDDLGRRRRRLLSIPSEGAESEGESEGEGESAGADGGAGRKLLSAAASGSAQLLSWERAIEKEAHKLQAPSARTASPKRHPRAAARDAHHARVGKKAAAAAAAAAGAPTGAAATGGSGGGWGELVAQAQAQTQRERAAAVDEAKADVKAEEAAAAGKVATEVREKMARAAAAAKVREARLKRMAAEAVREQQVEAAVRASQRQRAALQVR